MSGSTASPSSHFEGSSKTRSTPTRPPIQPWVHFLGGGIGGTVGSVLLCPLEVVKTRLQSSGYSTINSHSAPHSPSSSTLATRPLTVSRNPLIHVTETLHILRTILVQEGRRGLFKGLGPNLVGAIPARAISFASYGNGKRFLTELNNGVESPWIHLTAAANAGIITATFTNPIWLVKTRLQLPGAKDLYSSSFDCLRTVLKQEGLRGLYRGLSASYLGVAEGTLQWVVYEQMKRSLAQHRLQRTIDPSVSPTNQWSEYLVAASTAKLIAAIVTYPHEVIRTRMREAPSPGKPPKYTGLLQTLRVILDQEGFRALYGGLTAHLMRVVPNAAILFVCYEGTVSLFSSSSSSS
ncbi:MAG: mitochondrial carrier protein [Piptocephalis tieghemiana]|nr:MAG: mitochondrial carrier protein [Piptocephalis tieghemiana]